MSSDTGGRISEAEHAVMEALWTCAPLVAHLAEAEALTGADIAEIEALLETLTRKGQGQ